MNKNLGLIGAGEFGNFATKVLKMLPDFKLVAIADTNENSALNLAKKYNAKVYRNYIDLLKNKNVDIVLINTPNFLHAKMSMDCISYGKKVMCEKPLGINIREIELVRKHLVKNKGILLVNFLLPRSDIYQKLHKIISTKDYGELKYIHIENLATESTIESKWYWQKEKSGGWFLTADIHFYDLVNFLLDHNSKVVSAKEYIKHNRTVSILTELCNQDVRIDVFHDFAAGYNRARLTAKFVFDKADIQINGWIPTQMIVRTSDGNKIIKEKIDREIIYQKLVAENISELAKMSHIDSIDHINHVFEGSQIAFSAQKIADRME